MHSMQSKGQVTELTRVMHSTQSKGQVTELKRVSCIALTKASRAFESHYLDLPRRHQLETTLN
jgi:hypothetical protein